MSERDLGEFSSGDVACPCGQIVHLYWNGGELDQQKCACGLEYRTEHRSTVLIVREPDAAVSSSAPPESH